MKKTNQLTKTAVVSALTIVFLLLGNVVRTNTLSFLVLASLTTGIVLVLVNFKYSTYHYCIVSILSLLIIPDKSIGILYILFFGSYGIIKLLIEKLKYPFIMIILKNIFTIAVFYLAYKILGSLFINLDVVADTYNIPEWIFLMLLLFIFNIYDYIYTYALQFLIRRFRIR